MRTDTGLPPAGFPGNNDWWHHHPWICHRKTDAAMIAFNTSDATCTAQGGVNVNMSNYYMLHVWVLDDMKFEPDVFAGMIPCIIERHRDPRPEPPVPHVEDGWSHDRVAVVEGRRRLGHRGRGLHLLRARTVPHEELAKPGRRPGRGSGTRAPGVRSP